MSVPWYLDPITQKFNGGKEKGVDLGVPYHTPVTPLFPGRVTAIHTGPYGQEVDVAGVLNGRNVTASYVHLDLATVVKGQTVGQNTQLGLSGGQLAGGYHPASPLYSSGPHIEFSLWPQGTTPYVGAPYDPMQFINSIQKSGGAEVANRFQGTPTAAGSPTTTPPTSDQTASYLSALANWLPGFSNAFSNNLNASVSNGVSSGVSAGISAGVQGAASGIGKTILGAFHAQSLPDLMKRAALIGGGMVLLLIVANALSSSAVRGASTTIINSEPVKQASNTAASVGKLASLGG